MNATTQAIASLLLGLALALAACSPAPPLTAQDLVLTRERYSRLTEVEAVVLIVDQGQQPPSADVQDLRAARMVSAGHYHYRVLGPPGAALKAHIMLFVDEAAARAHWQTRHQPESLALTQPLAAGDEAWILDGRMSALRVGRAIIELRSREPFGDLALFTQLSAQQAERRLRR